MDMGTSSMLMPSATAGMDMASTATAAAATATAAMAGMDMGGDGMGNNCKISMLWNWYTIDTCFISASWQNKTSGMFAGSCIGVIFLVIALEFFRRLSKEYDRYIIRQHQRLYSSVGTAANDVSSKSSDPTKACDRVVEVKAAAFRPNLLQQAVRATIHMVQFAIAYFVMLLAMYYNGYIIICIFIGAWIGSFIFSWETIALGGTKDEPTVCCG